jgi:hypothetical protein
MAAIEGAGGRDPTKEVPQFPRNRDEVGFELTDGFAGEQIRRLVSIVVKRCRLSGADGEQLEQDLRLALLRRLHRYDARRGSWPAFVFVALSGQSKTLARRYERYAREVSLYGDPETSVRSLADRLSGVNPSTRKPSIAASAIARFELRHDLNIALSRMQMDIADACADLESDSVAAVARKRRTPRRTFRGRLVKARDVLIDHDLDKYL